MESSNSNSKERELQLTQRLAKQRHSNCMTWVEQLETHLYDLYLLNSPYAVDAFKPCSISHFCSRYGMTGIDVQRQFDRAWMKQHALANPRIGKLRCKARENVICGESELMLGWLSQKAVGQSPTCRIQVAVQGVNAPNYSRNSHKESYGSNDMVHAYFLEDARKMTQDKTRIPSHKDMASTRAHCTPNACTLKPRNIYRSSPVSKCSGGMSNGEPLVDHSRNSSFFLDSKQFVCSICHKYIFNTNHDDCIIKILNKVNSRAKVQSPKIRNNNPVEPKNHTHKPGRQNGIGQRFSLNKSSAVHEKPHTPRSCLRWKPTGRIFKTVSLRWIPTGKMFTDSTTKVDSEPPNGSNDDITNPYECNQTLYFSAGTSNSSAGTSVNPLKERLRKRIFSLTEAEEEAVAREVHATHARSVSESEPEPTQRRQSGIAFRDSFIVSKKRSSDSSKKLKGSNEGTGNILGVPDESTVVSRASSKGTGSKPGVPDEEKLILEWEANVDSEHFNRDDNAGDDNEETKPDPEEIYK
ncbi:hypothetical protein Tco_0976905 [Tanacetum coccineum]|uniref:Uncharacterized protein n=1 Tax=Tanacetum coccineum TaxID=301880 RepID=A0ABQ5EIN1_9ASTR